MQFRKWANNILKEYTIQGWTMDVERLKNTGTISMEVARHHAETEWEKYRIVQDHLFESDFDSFLQLDNEVKKIEKKGDIQ